MYEFALDAEAPLDHARGLEVKISCIRISGRNRLNVVRIWSDRRRQAIANEQRRRRILIGGDDLTEEERQVLIELSAALARFDIGHSETAADNRLTILGQRIREPQARRQVAQIEVPQTLS